MDYEMQLAAIIKSLSLAIDAHDENGVRKAYEEILTLGTENDFWCEVFSDGADWDIRIAAEVKRQRLGEDGKTMLSISDLCLIKNIDLFEELLQGEVNMDTVSQCMEMLQDDGGIQKIQLIVRKLLNTNKELKDVIEELQYNPGGFGYTSLFTPRDNYFISQK